MRAEIICVGTELLLGDILNTNAQYLSRALSELGIGVYNQQVVGDNKERLEQAVRIAKERSDIVIFSGGLGPTDDDLTKQTVAAVYNDELVHNAEIEEKIRLHFEKMNRVMTDNNKKQAYVPKRGRFLPNDNGTAPGIMFIDGEKLAILLPGPPRELEPMMANQVMPILSRLVKGVIKSRYVKTMCIGESMLETKIAHFLESENPTAALYAKGDGEVTVRLTAKALEEKEATDMLDGQYKALEAEIGEYIYGVDVDNAETVIVNTLKRTMQSVAVAESCTGGKIASRITSVAGASQIFELGVCTYSNRQKVELLDVNQDDIETYTEVSSQVAAQMAQNVRLKAESDYGVSTTGYAGPGGKDVGLVYIAVATADKTYVVKHHFGGKRETIINLASQYALDMLRRVMCGIPVADAEIVEQPKAKKKKGSIGKAILTFIMLVIISAALAFGWLWYKNGMDVSAVPVLKDVFSTQTVASVIAERQNTDFFQKGFEQETSDMISGSWAQNHRLKGWITVKTTKEEFAVGSRRQSENQPDSIVYEDSSIAQMKTYAGFGGDVLCTEDKTADITGDIQLTVFDTNNSYREYFVYAVVTYTQQQYDGLMKMSDSIDVAKEAVKDSAVKFETSDIGEFDHFIALKQQHENGNITVYFAKNDTGGIVVQKPASTPEADSDSDSEDESSSEDESNSEDESSSAENGEPTASPSSTPTASPSAHPDESPDASPSVIPSETPTASPTATVKPTATPSASPSATPKATATPTATIKPTATPTATPKPTATPTAKPTPTPTAKPTPTPTQKPSSGYTLTVTMDGKLVTGPANEVLAMIVSKEMTGSWNAEALKAQAVATHTYLRYQYASGNSAPAVSGRETPYATVVAAVDQVADKIMTINGKAIYTPYFASSAGRTNSSAEVWGGHYSHLVSVESKYDHLANGYKGEVVISLDDMEEIIEDIGIEPKGDPEDWFEIISYTSGGYVNEMKICGQTKYNGKTITGRKMREDILKGKGMRSAAFDIEYNADKEKFTFTTYGYGHGAGMSQWGAQLYAQNEGWSYKQILTHYYTGVTIQSIN